MSRRFRIRWMSSAAIAMLSVAALIGVVPGAEVLQAIRVTEPGPLMDLEAPYWARATAVQVTMFPQVVTSPTNAKAAVTSLTVKAAHNGQWLALLLEWSDPTKSERIVLDEFGDQVAVQVPVHFNKDAVPSPMMGNPGGRVNIWQWRAAFQHDIDHGEPTVHDLYPNTLVDVYPDQVLRAIDARPYSGALGVDNPISRPRASPVLDQMAEGWGTMTVHTEQNADGRGAWKDGVWRVVITHPLATASPHHLRLEPGGETVVAFAAWDGGNREVGPRKSWSGWVPLKLTQ
jgi:hypothetical protein